MARPFEFLVVGKGMMGAAALRYLSATSSQVVGIGPDEPPDLTTHRGVFSSHYDQGRITTRLSRDATWARLTELAMAGYAGLETAAGVRFHAPVGLVYAAPKGSPSLAKVRTLARELGADHVELADAALEAHAPGLRLPAGFDAVLERAPAGILEPRALIQAQLTLARAQGARLVSETVVACERAAGHWELRTEAGHRYQAHNVLFCVGAYSSCFGLMPRGLALRVKSETTLLTRVPPAEARRLAGMPCLAYEIDSPTISDVYMVPPLRYPDGHDYIKLGCNTAADTTLGSLAEIQDWMIHGLQEPPREMQDALRDLLPSAELGESRVKRCLVTYTAHGAPYIDALGDGLFIATGGNGSGAACSDTLGRMASALMLGQPWPEGLERARFERRFDVASEVAS